MAVFSKFTFLVKKMFRHSISNFKYLAPNLLQVAAYMKELKIHPDSNTRVLCFSIFFVVSEVLKPQHNSIAVMDT
jgi:hypothetical protein